MENNVITRLEGFLSYLQETLNKIKHIDVSNIDFKNILFLVGNLLLLFFGLVMFIIFISVIVDLLKKYDTKKFFKKKQKRTGKNTIGGGQEYYLRYWVWQRRKRKCLIRTLASLTFDNMYYPKNKWKKRGKVIFFGRREIWINSSDIDKEKFNVH